MSKLRIILAVLMFVSLDAHAQTLTTLTGTIKDSTGAVVTSGTIQFKLQASDSTIPGVGRFVGSTVYCDIDAGGHPVATGTASACQITSNTAMFPAGTSYATCIQPYGVQPGGCFNFFALAGQTIDISTIAPTPTTLPLNYLGAASFQLTTNFSSGPATFINGILNVPIYAASGGCGPTDCVQINPTLSQTVTQPGATSLNINRINNVMHADLFPGADIGAKINTAFAACPVTSGCQIVLPPGNSYPYTTKIIIPAALQYYSLDCSHSTIVWGGTGDAIQVSSRNDDKPTGDITGCYIQNNPGNTSSTAAIHQLPRAQFTYRDNTIVGFNNSGGGAFLLDNIAESWGGYSERTHFYDNIVSDNKYGWKFYGNNGGTDSFARTLMYGNTCNTFGSINETCILVTSPTSGSTTAHLYDSHIDIRGNLGGTSTGVALTNGGVIRLSEFTTGFEDNGSGTATGIYVDSASGVFNNSGNVSLELSANPVVNLGTSDQYSAPILSNVWTLQAPPDYFGQHQSRNPKFSWDFANIRLGQPWAESGNPNPALGYFQLYNRVTSNGDPEVDAAPSTGNKQFNTLFATAGKVGIGPGFGPDATHGQVAGRVAVNTLDVAGDTLADFSAQVPRFTDLNTLVRCGMYTVNDPTNAPAGVSGYIHLLTQCDGAGTGYNLQYASNLTGGYNRMWIRISNGGTWNDWSLMAFGPVPFGQISSDTNTTAAMICGAGCSMNFASTGTINASSIAGVAPTNNPTIGYVPTATSTTTYSWQPPSGGGGAPTGTGFAHYTSGVLDTAAIGETGTSTVVRSASPTLTGTVTAPVFNATTNVVSPSFVTPASGTATSGANFNSGAYGWNGSYWTGSVSNTDNWIASNVLGAGANPTSTLTFSHTGSSGTANVSVPNLTVLGTCTGCGGGGSGITGATSGEFTVASSATTIGSSVPGTGTGNVVRATSPTLVTPALGTPSAIVLTSGTGLPLSTGVTGTLQAAQEPAHTADVTNTAGSLAMKVVALNNTNLAGLATGILKNTTTTGVPSIAVAGTDYLTPTGNGSGLTALAYGNITGRPWNCQPGFGDGLNAITAGTYLQSVCRNETGSTVTLTGFTCYADAGSPTLNVTNGAGTGLLTGAVTCTTSFASGTQSGTTTLANGDYLKFTFVDSASTKQSTWTVKGTY